MLRLKLLVLAGLLAAPLPLVAATQVAAQAAQGPAMPGPDTRHHGGPLAGLLSPRQRVAFMIQAREQTKDMSRDQKRAWRKDQFQKLASLSESDRQKLRSDMQARWDALPADRKARIEQRMAERKGADHAAH